MMNIKEFPTLYKKSKNGKLSEWDICVYISSDNFPVIKTSYGYSDGKKQTSEIIVDTGKNISKSNSTTPIQQAILMASSKWESQKLLNYRELENLNDILKLPMKAVNGKKYINKIKYPAFIQPKLNGVRGTSSSNNNEIEFISKLGKPFMTLSHINEELYSFIGDDTFDGEIFIHGLPLQDIIKRLKRSIGDRGDIDDLKLEYHIYDIFLNNMTFEDRYHYLLDRFSKHTFEYVKLLQCDVINCREDIDLFHKKYVDAGYEGSIIRNKDGLYLAGFRSYDLLKWKDFEDEEYRIIGGKSAKGNDKGTVVFICELYTNGPTFEVRPKGSRKERIQMLDNIENIKGKMLTVQYKDKSSKNIPLFPVGLAIRDYE